MATSAKAIALARSIASELRLRQSALAVAESFDSDGSPLVKLGTGSIGAAGGLIKVRPQDWPLAKDILGLTASIYSPHVIQLVTEANYEGATDNVLDINTPAVLLLLLGEALSKGCRVEWYQSANGNAPDASDITSGNLKASWDPSFEHGMIANQ